MSTVSLCVITGNEEIHVARFLDSFADSFDELCMVRAVGNVPHDKTVKLAKEWCEKHLKKCRIGEYRNHGWRDGGESAPVSDDDPATWPHVDDFAAARNQSFALATCDWTFWADLDDILVPGGAALMRAAVGDGRHDGYFCKYAIRTSGEHNMRERIYRRGTARWNQPIHETCHLTALPDGRKEQFCYLKDAVFEHIPFADKPRDPFRNRRIMQWWLRHLDGFAFELHKEWFYQWQLDQKPEHAEKSIKWAEVAQQANTPPEQRYDMMINVSQIRCADDPNAALDLCWDASRLFPWRRDAWGWMAEYELRLKRPTRAVWACETMGKLAAQPETGFPVSNRFYGWMGMVLHTRALRAANREDFARKIESHYFEANGKRISLLHATRGRPEKAVAARQVFFQAALRPLAIEHIFAVDADDAASMEGLREWRRVVVDEPRGCVKAWNAAAAISSGHILVQLSDDWIPCWHWDELIWLAVDEAAKKRGGTIETEPLVLAIRDGHRQDALLCMAILTRARYTQQGHLFCPEYESVYSDTEFTARAHDDGVVVAAPHIMLEHQHPIFAGKPEVQWDETYRVSNAPERYARGKETFNRRNPKHAIP